MSGPPPKDPEQRQRRNKTSTRADLDPQAKARRVPPLPGRLFPADAEGKRKPDPSVRNWWRVIWRSPMSSRWLDADVEGLYLIAQLRHAFAGLMAEGKPGITTIASEIRQQEARFGLDVLARRRLDWRIGGAPAATSKPVAEPDREASPPMPDPASDPRRTLRAVS